MTRPTGSAESTMNSVSSSTADPATANMFQPPVDAVVFSTKPELQSACCRLHDLSVKPARCVATGADMTEPDHLVQVGPMVFAEAAPAEGPALAFEIQGALKPTLPAAVSWARFAVVHVRSRLLIGDVFARDGGISSGQLRSSPFRHPLRSRRRIPS
jgi:hypothetical protein